MRPGLPDHLLLAHGAGGRLTRELVEGTFLPALDNQFLRPLSDAAVLPELPAGRPALTTDAFVVDPPIFPGGTLGHLSICGTVNDLSMAGARPLWLTWALILEEGAPGELIRTCVDGARQAACEAGVQVVAGDTKVVPRGKGDRIYAVSTGLGVVPPDRDIGDHRMQEGDVILASGPLGDHGATIMACRHDLGSETLQSDCAPLAGLVEALLSSGVDVHSLHDPTRGGLVAVTNEAAGRSGLRQSLDERSIPLRAEVRAVCEVLGLDPLGLASEGRLIAWVAQDHGTRALDALRAHPLGLGAAIVGRVEALPAGGSPVILTTSVGGTRPLDLLSGSDLPRIC